MLMVIVAHFCKNFRVAAASSWYARLNNSMQRITQLSLPQMSVANNNLALHR